MQHKIKNLKEAAERIKKAVQNKERIILYGDSDMDGISSVVSLKESIELLGGKVFMACFPDRERDGYGLNEKAVKFLADKVPALLVTLDLGIGNIKEIEQANALGFEVVVVDHHEPLASVPSASIVVDIKQPGDESEFKGLANVGITYNLCRELLGDAMTEEFNNSLLELAALGTIADMVPQIHQNAEIIEQGLKSLRQTKRPALKELFDILGSSRMFDGNLPKVISALNAGESFDFQNESFKLLTCDVVLECRDMAEYLLGKQRNKQEQIKNIVAEVERRIARQPDEPIIFEGDPAWRLVLAGAVASILFSKYNKPVFIFKKGEDEACGSVRNPLEVNSVAAMQSCAPLLITYGGHTMASGFRLKTENLTQFKEGLIKYFSK